MQQIVRLILAALGALSVYATPWILMSLTWFMGPPELPIEVIEAPRRPAVALWIPAIEPTPEVLPDPEGDPEGAGDDVAQAPVPVRPQPGAPTDAVAPPSGPGASEGRSGSGSGRARRRRRSPRCEAPHPHVREAADGVVEIDRSFVEDVTKDLQSFMSLGYSRPHHEDDVKGWYISGFSCSSPVHKAGFRRRDVLLRVNGKKTRSWVGVYLLYQKLKKKSDFEVELLRGGEPKTLRFRVVSR